MLENHIYTQLYVKNDKQIGFKTTPSKEKYKKALESITSPEHMNKYEDNGWIFVEDGKEDYKNRGRFVVNLQPESIVDGTAKKLIEEVTQLDCVYSAKVVADAETAVNRLDPVVVFFDTTDRKSKDRVTECLSQYKDHTRPGLPAGMEPTYKGIGFANQSVVEKDKSWGTMITESIAEIAWALKSDKRPIEFETLWPRVESDLRKKGILEI